MQNEEEPDEQPLSTPAGRGRGRGRGRGSKKTPVPEACKGTAKDPEDVVPEKAAGLDPTSSVKGKKGQGRGRGHGSKKNPMLEAVEGTDKPDPVPEACTGTDKKGAAAPEEAAGFDRSSVVKGKKGQGRGRGRGSKKNPVPEAFEGTEKPDPVPQACVAMGSGGPAVERSSPLKKKARASKAPECDAGRSYESPKGNPYSNAACKGNTLCTRFVLLALLGLIRRVWWLVEQPGSSLAYLLPVVQWLMRANGVHISFVPGTLQRLLLVAKLLHEWQTNQNQQHHFYPALEIDLSWMGLYGSQTLKRSLAFGNW
eukprot:s2951_g2.t1